jgi:hypothetical protein
MRFGKRIPRRRTAKKQQLNVSRSDTAPVAGLGRILFFDAVADL